MTFKPKYFYSAILLLGIEVGIAAFCHDQFIRPFGGDVLVVILIYCLIRAFWSIRPTILALAVFGWACAIEGLQYVHFVDALGLRQYPLLPVILGTSFDWGDIVAYGLGTAIILGWERRSRFLAIL